MPLVASRTEEEMPNGLSTSGIKAGAEASSAPTPCFWPKTCADLLYWSMFHVKHYGLLPDDKQNPLFIIGQPVRLHVNQTESILAGFLLNPFSLR